MVEWRGLKIWTGQRWNQWPILVVYRCSFRHFSPETRRLKMGLTGHAHLIIDMWLWLAVQMRGPVIDWQFMPATGQFIVIGPPAQWLLGWPPTPLTTLKIITRPKMNKWTFSNHQSRPEREEKEREGGKERAAISIKLTAKVEQQCINC